MSVGWGVARVATALVLAAGLMLALAAERRSAERANRLHRAGKPGAAAALYRERVRADSNLVFVRYNLGTALLALGSDGAEPELARATVGEDVELRRQALYNLGVWSLGRALAAAQPDSARAHAGRAVDLNKDVLRLAPGHPGARWNLALAERLLDSLESADGRPGPASLDPSAPTDRLVPSDDARTLENVSDLRDAPRRGADEAPASADHGAPLSLLEAAEILERTPLDASAIIGKLLTFEGRFRRPLRTSPQIPRW